MVMGDTTGARRSQSRTDPTFGTASPREPTDVQVTVRAIRIGIPMLIVAAAGALEQVAMNDDFDRQFGLESTRQIGIRSILHCGCGIRRWRFWTLHASS